MYRKPKFLEILHDIRQQMAEEGDYDMNRFLQMIDRQSVSTESEPAFVPPSPILKSRRSRTKKTQKKL